MNTTETTTTINKAYHFLAFKFIQSHRINFRKLLFPFLFVSF